LAAIQNLARHAMAQLDSPLILIGLVVLFGLALGGQ
jgi:hypothetical protein